MIPCRRSFLIFAALLVAGPLLVLPGPAAAERYASIIVDAESGEVLHSRYAESRRHPASLTKMMTLYLLFEALEDGEVTLNQALPVSRRAAGQPPSRLGLRRGSTISVENAILALVTKSANDVAVVIAEALGGTEAQFARQMTLAARRLGMTRTTFRNASGLYNRGQLTTAQDIAVLSIGLMRDFPEEYQYFSTASFTWHGRTYRNHNRLLGRYDGTDGIKTGYIRASGFNLAASVVRNDQRLIGVVMGGRTGRSRDAHMMELLNQAFAGRMDVDRSLEVALSHPRRERSQIVPTMSPATMGLLAQVPPDSTPLAPAEPGTAVAGLAPGDHEPVAASTTPVTGPTPEASAGVTEPPEATSPATTATAAATATDGGTIEVSDLAPPAGARTATVEAPGPADTQIAAAPEPAPAIAMPEPPPAISTTIPEIRPTRQAATVTGAPPVQIASLTAGTDAVPVRAGLVPLRRPQRPAVASLLPPMRPGRDFAAAGAIVVASLLPPMRPGLYGGALPDDPEDAAWSVQVGAFREVATAELAIELARQTAPDQLAQAEAAVLPVDTELGRYWRARLTGIGASNATEACETLHSHNIACLAMEPEIQGPAGTAR